jgi:hypothetical protein
MFSLRYDFPSEWASFTNGNGNMSITLRKEQFPHFAKGKTITVESLEIYVRQDETIAPVTVSGGDGVLPDDGFPITLETSILKPTMNDAYLVVHYCIG